MSALRSAATPALPPRSGPAPASPAASAAGLAGQRHAAAGSGRVASSSAKAIAGLSVLAAGAGGTRRRRRPKTARGESLSQSFQSAWLQHGPDEWKPDGLRGNWAPVREEVSDVPVEVMSGKLPADLPAGYFVRNGPNPRWVRPLAGYHPFEGDGMLHSLRFGGPGNGQQNHVAQYSNRWIRTPKWFAEDVAQMPLASGMIDENYARAAANTMLNIASVAVTASAILSDDRMKATPGGGDTPMGTANTSIIAHAGKVMALQEQCNPVVIELPSLETKGSVDAGGKFTAHPKVCPITGELLWFSYREGGIDYGVWDKHGMPTHQTFIPLSRSIMAHDIAATENFTVVVDCPLLFSPKDILEGKGPVRFEKEEPMRFGVLPRHGQGEDVEWYTVPGAGKACFHVMNAYEDPSGEIVIVGCSMPEVSLMDMNVAFADQERLTEWRINPQTRCVSERMVSEVSCDFPTINPSFAGQPFRFGYAAAFTKFSTHGGVPMFRGILKHDLQSGESKVWEAEPGTFFGEPVFVPRVGAQAGSEDDGYLLVHAHNEHRDCSEILVLDAQQFEQAPVCRLKLPCRVPYGFHAAWIPADH